MRGLRLAAAIFLVAAAVTAAIAVATGWDRWETLRDGARGVEWRVHVGWLAGALACAVGALLATARLWVHLYRDAGAEVETGEGMAAWLGSNLGRYLPGKIWQITGIAAYLRGRGGSGSAGLATSLGLQAALLVTGAALALIVLRERAFPGLPPAVAVVAALTVGAFLHPRLLDIVVRVGSKVLREAPPDRSSSAAALGRAAVGGIAIWSAYGLGVWSLVRGLNGELSVGPIEATGAFAAAYVAGYVVLVAPGGLVVREGALSGLLVALTGMPLGAAAAIAVAARIWTTVGEICAFVIAGGVGLRGRGRSG